MHRGTHTVGLSGGLNQRHATWLAIAGTLILAAVVAVAGTAVVGPAPADAGLLSCKGRNATIIAVPGVRSTGTSGADVMVGFPLYKDTLDARGGKDLVCGNDDRDHLYGKTDNDRLHGGPGKDRLDGGAGFDRCFGNSGRDIAVNCERVGSAVDR